MTQTNQETFSATIQQEGKFKFIALPFSPREVWEAKPPYYVAGTINGIPVRGTLGALGQDYFLRLSAAWLKDSGIEIGDRVFVKLSIEDRPKNT